MWNSKLQRHIACLECRSTLHYPVQRNDWGARGPRSHAANSDGVEAQDE